MSNKRHTRIGPHHAPAGRFTGKQKTGSKRKRGLTRKQRKLKRRTHVNKYA